MSIAQVLWILVIAAMVAGVALVFSPTMGLRLGLKPGPRGRRKIPGQPEVD